MAGPEDILRQFQDVTNGFLKQHEETGAVKFLRTAVKSLEKITKRIDDFLKTKNINVTERLSQLSEKTSSIKDQAKSLFSGTKTDIKSMGMMGFMKDKGSKIKSALTEAFASDTETSGAPPDEEADTKEGFVSKLQASISQLATSVKDLSTRAMPVGSPGSAEGGVAVSSSKSSDSADYQASLNQAKERADARAKEIAEEKEAVKKKGAKPKGKGNWLSKVLGGITKLGGMVVGGFGKIMLSAIPALSKLTGKAIGMVLGRFVPNIAGAIARATGKGMWGAAKTGGKFLARTAVPALWAGAKALGGAVLGAVGGTALAIGGAVVGAGLLIYGGYKLYKYLNRNSIDTDIFGKLTRLRLLMYGFNDTNKEQYHKLLELEMMMKDFVQYKDGKVSFVKFDKKVKDKVLELFEVKYDEKEKYRILNTWFIKRFMPGLKSFLDAFLPLGPNLYLDKIDKLSSDKVFELASRMVVPTEVFDITQIPSFDNPTSLVAKKDVDDMMSSIRTQAKEGSKTFQAQGSPATSRSKAAPSTTTTTTSTSSSTQTSSSASTGSGGVEAAAMAKLSPNLTTSYTASSNAVEKASKTIPEAPNQEGEAPVKDESGKPLEKPVSVPSEATKLNIAPGGLQAGDKSLQGVSIGAKGDRSRLFGLNPTVFNLFSGMAKEFNTLTGKNITVNESFRTYDDQMALRKKYPNKAAKPGNSIHEYGMGIDINTPEADLLDSMGLMRKYGFTRPVGGETWHLEPAGVAVNPQLAKTDPAARQQALESSPGRGGGGFGSVKSTPLGKRNQQLQQKLFAEGSASTVNLAELAKSDQAPASTFSGPAPTPSAPQTSQASASPSTPSGPSKGGYAGSMQSTKTASVSSAMTQDSLTRTDPATSGSQGLDQTPKASNANLDPGAVGTKNLHPVDAIRKASGVVGMNPETMITFAKVESSLDPNAGAKTSSAKGLFQITKPTWNGLLSKQGSQYNVPSDADIFDPYYNALMGISYAKENAAQAIPAGQKAGIPDEIALYLAHHFGPSGSKRLIEAYMKNPNMSTQEAVSSATFSANQAALAGKTVGQYIDSLRTKMSTAAKTPETAYKGVKGLEGPKSSSSNNTYALTSNESSSRSSSTVTETTPTPVSGTSNVYTSTTAAKSPSTAQSVNTAGYGDYSASSATVPQTQSVRTELPPQSSQTQGLKPTEEILNNQLSTLIDIKKILEAMSGRMGTAPPNTSAPNRPPSSAGVSSEPAAAGRASEPSPIMAPMGRAPSTTSISMSRRPIA